MNIAILDDYHGVALREADWSVLGPDVRVQSFNQAMTGQALIEALKPFNVVVAMRERTAFPAEVVGELPNLRLLVTTGLRNNAIDMAACRAWGIDVCGAPGSDNANTATSELAWTLLLALNKNLLAENTAMRSGLWQTLMPQTLSGRRLGVVGLGKLGQATARVGLAFGMDVVAWSPNLTDERAQAAGVKRVEKDELFRTSDAVSLHIVLSERTRHLVDAQALSLMKPSAFLVNTSRAGLVDMEVLLERLRSRKLGGAGIDVYDIEPLPADDPIRSLDNVVITPHLGYVSPDNFHAYFQNAVAAVQAWKSGSPIRVLNAAA